MDEDADRDPEAEGEINERRGFVRELDQEFRERREKLEQKASADPWDYWPETHDDLENPADYEMPPLWEVLRKEALNVKRAKQRGEIDFEEGYPPVKYPAHGGAGRPCLVPHC